MEKILENMATAKALEPTIATAIAPYDKAFCLRFLKNLDPAVRPTAPTKSASPRSRIRGGIS